ncbi:MULTISPECIES: pirin-like C-terminal cupin domain-containing protein, partial [unclassified Microcoleus]|uniref:pirin-like C-terminal cupin domain-containing protein n=1 Tax=unclassified Microcoleus TaxID=2642155 RepID=UPI002FD450A5
AGGDINEQIDWLISESSRLQAGECQSEQAVYSVTEGLAIDGVPLEQHRLAVLNSGTEVNISASAKARCIVIGGEPVGERHKWWNFVSSRHSRIEQAKLDWREGRFAQVPHETEFIPLPEEPPSAT